MDKWSKYPWLIKTLLRTLDFVSRNALLIFSFFDLENIWIGFQCPIRNVLLCLTFKKKFKNEFNPMLVVQIIVKILEGVRAANLYFLPLDCISCFQIFCASCSLEIISNHQELCKYILTSLYLMIESLKPTKHEVFTA